MTLSHKKAWNAASRKKRGVTAKGHGCSAPPHTAAIYARFSCSKQREASIADQVRICREWCGREGYVVVATYTDEAISGRTDNRPEFQRMIENAGESEVVIVYAFDRFSRDVYDAPHYKAQLSRKGVRLLSATETVPEGPEGILMDKLYEGFAAMESARIARRTRRGMEGNALKHLHNGVKVYGYKLADDGTYLIDEEEAGVVREVFERRVGGEAMNHIAADLANRGVLTTRGNPCSHAMVKSMLSNEKYKGVYAWGDVREDGAVPAIVSKEVWEMAQRAHSKKQRKVEDWGEYPLAGVAYCRECGANLVGVSGRGAHNVKYTYYRCAKRCGCKPVRQDWLEAAIIAEVRRLLESRETALNIANHLIEHMSDERAEQNLAAARKRQAEAQRAYDNLIRAVEQGMPWAAAANRMDELSNQIANAQAEVVRWEHQASVSPQDLADFLQSAQALDDETLLKAFVHQVWLSTDDVTVVLRYSKENELAHLDYVREFEESSSGSPYRIRTGDLRLERAMS